MSRTRLVQSKHDTLWIMVCASAIAHVTVYLFFLNFQFPAHFKQAQAYYVDVVNLPVASPQAGTPTATERGAPAPPPPPAAPKPREMAMPAQTPKKSPVKQPVLATLPNKPEPAESAHDFEEKLASLEREAAARHESAAIEALRKRGAGKGTVGMPGAAGTEAGSDYASYIQSRLRDTFKTTISFQSKNPEVMVRITINRLGRVARLRTERSSGDKIFEDSVSRTIAKAEQTFRPPPRGEEIDIGFVFRPQGIGKN